MEKQPMSFETSPGAEDTSHLQHIREVFANKIGSGLETLEEMVASIQREVTFMEMVETSWADDGGSYNSAAEQYSNERLPKVREQLVLATQLLDQYKSISNLPVVEK